MNLVATLNVGPKYAELARVTQPTIEAYAKKIGADFKCIDTIAYPGRKPQHEKYQLGAALQQYERIMFIDIDAIVRPNAPNLFDVVPVGSWGAFNEAPCPWWTDAVVRKHYNKFQLPETWSWENLWYLNSGVFVFDRAHEAVFKDPIIVDTAYWDQDWFNFALRKLGLPVFFLAREFNCMWPREGDAVKEAAIAHFADAGKGGPTKLAHAREILAMWATL